MNHALEKGLWCSKVCCFASLEAINPAAALPAVADAAGNDDDDYLSLRDDSDLRLQVLPAVLL